jgi:hypothetical protein
MTVLGKAVETLLLGIAVFLHAVDLLLDLLKK